MIGRSNPKEVPSKESISEIFHYKKSSTRFINLKNENKIIIYYIFLQ
jgi:hypothetical protein